MLLTGQGFASWDESATVEENRLRLMPDCDFVLWYKPLGAPKDGVPPLRGIDSLTVPAAMSFNECWWPGHVAARDVEQTGTRLVILHHHNDRPRFTAAWGEPAGSGVVSVYPNGVWVASVPHGAEESVFGSAAGWEDRPIDIMLAGTMNADVYPRRWEFREWIEAGLFTASSGRPLESLLWLHPGTRLESPAACDDAVLAYARALRRAKVALVCPSAFLYPLAKYPEAAMAGCIVAGDMPEHPPLGYRRMVVDLTGLGPEEVLAKIRPLCEDRAAWEAQAMAGRQIARERFSMDMYAKRLLLIFREYLSANSVLAGVGEHPVRDAASSYDSHDRVG